MRDACYERADDGSDRLPSDVVHGIHWMYFGEDESARECSRSNLPQLNGDTIPILESFLEEWVETSPFRPSNKLLITKIFSTILDRNPVDPKLWGAISCPVLVIHGGKCQL